MKNILINKFFIILITIFLFNPNIAKAEHDFIIYPEPLRAPVSLFEDKHMEPFTLGSFHGKVTILNLWSVSCRPCIIEMPSLNKLKHKFKREKLAIITVAHSQNSMSKIRSFFRRYKLKELEYFKDKDNLTFDSYKTKEVPASFIFNKQGKLVASVSGVVDWNNSDNVKYIENLLKE